MERKNIEIKARRRTDIDYAPLAQELGAVFHGEIPQKDTYFKVKDGRLKLREFPLENRAELISYYRSNKAQARESRFRIQEISTPDILRNQLTETLGVDAVVNKIRSLFIWNNVRIHLDRVEGLGDFIELEAMMDKGSEKAESFQKINFLISHFSIHPEDTERRSYREMLLTQPKSVGIETHRLMVDRVLATDVDDFVEWFKGQEAERVGEPAFAHQPSREQLLERLYYSWEPGSPHRQLKAVDRATGEIIGIAEIMVESLYDGSGVITHLLISNPAYRGQGYGNEFIQGLCEYAFYFEGLRRLTVVVPEVREKAVKSFQTCGFNREGIATEYFRIGDKFVNGVQLALLKRSIPLS